MDFGTGTAIASHIRHLQIRPRHYAKLSPDDFLNRRLKAAAVAFATVAESSAPRSPAISHTGLCYDVRMRFHATLDEEDVHPEDPRRIHVIYKALVAAGLVSAQSAHPPSHLNKPTMLRISAREVTEEEALLVHTREHWQFLNMLPDLDKSSLLELTHTGDSVFYNHQSLSCAKLSCGGTIETCTAVWNGHVKNAIAVVRPPGHHAEPHKSMGFCLFNNVAVAARVVQNLDSTCRKVLILDWDVHHGNGTQTAFYKDSSVLYISLHRFEGGTFYPPNPDGDLTYCGEGNGLGFNVNIPWASGGIRDADYIYAFQRVVMPIAYEYSPDLVIISAGFDAAAGDKIGECYVTPAGYAHMTHMLMSLANGKVVVCLEGGYSLDSISASALAVVQTLMGQPPEPPGNSYVSTKVAEVVGKVVVEQSKYWNCMDFKFLNARISPKDARASRLHDVIRQYQSRNLFEDFRMTSLLVFRGVPLDSSTFEEQILATPNYDKSKVLVLVVHDSTTILGVPSIEHDTLQTHNAFMLDTAKGFIKWATDETFGVIDVNVSKFITPADDSDLVLQPKVSNISCSDEMNTVILQLWDNYIDLSEAGKIVFIGIGDAYKGLLNLISLRDCSDRVVACVNFVGRLALHPVNTTRDESVGGWYFKHSQVYVSKTHDVWTQPKRPKSKYGSLVLVDENHLDNLVRNSEDLAIRFISKMLSTK